MSQEMTKKQRAQLVTKLRLAGITPSIVDSQNLVREQGWRFSAGDGHVDTAETGATMAALFLQYEESDWAGCATGNRPQVENAARAFAFDFEGLPGAAKWARLGDHSPHFAEVEPTPEGRKRVDLAMKAASKSTETATSSTHFKAP